ncbi:MAG: hypothetical protein H7Z43_05365 [Clostridia bacterium]|nr:hypothetical protein [Deltaproteobacteria bacterium]
MRALLAPLALVAGILTHTHRAHASVNSIVAFGVNTALSMRQNNGDDPSSPDRTFVNSFGVQFKLLRIVALELNYAPIGTSNLAQQSVRYDNPWSTSALIYIVPLTPVAGYLRGGAGNATVGTLLNLGNTTATYHAGAGIEVHLTKHIVLGAEFLWLIPGASQVVNGVANQQHEAAYYVSPSNFRASFRASWYF